MAKRKRRNFSLEFRADVVLDALTGDSSQAVLCRRHNLSDEQLSKWKRQLLERASPFFEPVDFDQKKLVLTLTELWSKKTIALQFF